MEVSRSAASAGIIGASTGNPMKGKTTPKTEARKLKKTQRESQTDPRCTRDYPPGKKLESHGSTWPAELEPQKTGAQASRYTTSAVAVGIYPYL